MKKFALFLAVAVVGIASANAQKFALIDMEYILKNIPAY
jgi:outer membrane protein